MTRNEASELVVRAGRQLLESGLVARTWGNASCRIDEGSFVITPSGRDYLSLTPAEIVKVNMADLSYCGRIKPSSEKGIHAEVYKLHPEINFVIHTHQDYASAISATTLDSIQLNDAHPSLGKEVLCAPYALPGTKTLHRNVAKTLSRTKGNALIMKNHGALCFGKDYDEAFCTASELEKVCEKFIVNKYLELSGRESFDIVEMTEFALSLNRKRLNKNNDVLTLYYDSRRSKNGFVLYNATEGEIEVRADRIASSLPEEAQIYNAIYKKYKNSNYIIWKITPEITAISRLTLTLRPLLDDFAQIAGTKVKTVENRTESILAALKNSSVVFVQNRGALCLGKTKEDAFAVGIVTQKACLAYIAASLLGKIKPINHLECILMRFVYLIKYSKQAERGY